jgi:hypothetical protein
MMFVDGIIGEVLSSRAAHDRFSREFDPEELGYSQEHWDSLPEWEQRELVQDWAIGVEVEASMAHNPITKWRWEQTRMQFNAQGVKSWRYEYLTYPSADRAETMQERVVLINQAILNGSRVTLETPDCGEVSAEAWLPNFKVFGYSGLELLEDIACILALEKLKRLRGQTDGRGKATTPEGGA